MMKLPSSMHSDVRILVGHGRRDEDNEDHHKTDDEDDGREE